jgi:3-dehydroquinate synthase II
MKEVWLLDRNEDWDKVKKNAINALETGITGIIVREEFVDNIRKLGNLQVGGIYRNGESHGMVVVGFDGEGEGIKELPDELSGSWDLNLMVTLKEKNKKTGGFVKIRDEKSQKFAVEMAKLADYLFLDFSDWKIIPLENLIAFSQTCRIIAKMDSMDDIKTALLTLEKGADGILLENVTRDELSQVMESIKELESFLRLEDAVIVKIKKLGMGARACVDTTDLMVEGEGLLVGSRAGFLFLVHNESRGSEYSAPRPFRVNAGAISSYVRVGETTKYLSELETGDEVEIVDMHGKGRIAYIGRVKIEKRPLIMVEADHNGILGTIILQNAETVELVTPDGPVSVTALKEGMKVLAYIEEQARHFGIKVNETIIEK